MDMLIFFLARLGYFNQIRFFSNFSPVMKKRFFYFFFLSDKLGLAISFFQVSKENTKYKRPNNSMKFSTTGLPQVPQILTCVEGFLNTAFPIHCKNHTLPWNLLLISSFESSA